MNFGTLSAVNFTVKSLLRRLIRKRAIPDDIINHNTSNSKTLIRNRGINGIYHPYVFCWLTFKVVPKIVSVQKAAASYRAIYDSAQMIHISRFQSPTTTTTTTTYMHSWKN